MTLEAATPRLADQPGPAAWRGWYAAGIVVVSLVLAAVDRQVLTLLVQPIQASLRLTDTQMSLLYGLAFVAVYAVATLGVGWLADRYHRPSIIALGVAFWSVMTATCGLATSFPQLVLARAGVGTGEASIVPAGYSLVGDHFTVGERGRVIGVLNGVSTLGGGSALILGAMVVAIFGSAPFALPVLGMVEPWQATFLFLGCIGLPFALVVGTIREPRRAVSHFMATSTQRSISTDAVLPFLRAHKLTSATLFGAAACNSTAGIGLLTWAPTVLIRRLGTPAPQAGVMIGVALIIGGVAGSLITATLSDRWIVAGKIGGRTRGNPAVFALSACGCALLAFGPTPILCAAGFGLVAYGLNAVNAISYAAAQDLAPPHMRARALGALHFTISIIGYSFGSSIIAVITDYLYGDKQMLAWAMVTGGVPLFLLGAFLSFFGRRAVARTQAIVTGLAAHATS